MEQETQSTSAMLLTLVVRGYDGIARDDDVFLISFPDAVSADSFGGCKSERECVATAIR